MKSKGGWGVIAMSSSLDHHDMQQYANVCFWSRSRGLSTVHCDKRGLSTVHCDKRGLSTVHCDKSIDSFQSAAETRLYRTIFFKVIFYRYDYRLILKSNETNNDLALYILHKNCVINLNTYFFDAKTSWCDLTKNAFFI